MKNPILFASLTFLCSSPVIGQVNSKVHELCSQVKDYAGCVKTHNTTTEPVDGEECWGGRGKVLCLSGNGLDYLGMPKIPGTFYWINPQGWIWYYVANMEAIRLTGKLHTAFYQIPHKGESRYIANRTFIRRLERGSSGTPSSSTAIGNSRTDCTANNLGSTINCTTTPAARINFPGKPAVSPGVVVWDTSDVYDCKDKTKAVYRDGRLWINWKKINELPEECQAPERLPTLKMKL
jgi:hypothetical protein